MTALRNFTTAEIAADMIKGFEHSETMIAATYTWAYGKPATVNAAIRKLHKEGKIVKAYASVAGNIVWKKA